MIGNEFKRIRWFEVNSLKPAISIETGFETRDRE